ncbi:uncharacterized protein LACBIDRAFT_315151 [Laccaria bicolor S238N-H82]|uniref:Predicted protein n=1 Tax=Laccaria bicolor (strain S238N-H82 / ATCC MYA-4686) TaxID=486041 RepID=B0DZX8_LACBS|nr:uncharacterized protein LACBIDRAFT_315151 [Laccaria bicolor S238N-H82]EDQ99800.1 predicted protein [Laccaria bicolor S238N-H82]|eukprot:XP_001889492.1 predicted protein [Laccaria bicolor S238N-H82]
MASPSTSSCSPSSTVPTPSFNDHLSYPSDIDPEPTSEQQQPQQPRQLLKDRLYIGNLHPTVDEYSLLQVFSKFGKVSKLDFLFHKTGLLKGKPRGYAFIEYGSKDVSVPLPLPPPLPPRLSCVMPALRTLLLTLAFPFSCHASHESPILKICCRCSTIARDSSPRHTTTTPCFHVGKREKKRLIISH